MSLIQFPERTAFMDSTFELISTLITMLSNYFPKFPNLFNRSERSIAFLLPCSSRNQMPPYVHVPKHFCACKISKVVRKTICKYFFVSMKYENNGS